MRKMAEMKTGMCMCVSLWVCVTATFAWGSTGMDPTNKHAWAANAGWANAAPTNGGVTVHFDGASGYLTGCAWGENIGWVKFGDNTGGPYNNDSASDWGVNMDGSGNLSGYGYSRPGLKSSAGGDHLHAPRIAPPARA